MAAASFSSASELTGPSVIDAHLMSVACEGVGVVLTDTHRRLSGRLDLADGFAEIGFIDQSPEHCGHRSLGGLVSAEYYFDGGAFYRFETRIVGRTASDRFRLLRPRRITRSERRALPRVAGVHMQGASFELRGPEGAQVVEVADLSGGGARLVVPREAGLERRGQTVDGWLRLPDDVAIPLSMEVRHVAEHDTARLIVGVRFERVRAADQTRLAQQLAGFAAGVGG